MLSVLACLSRTQYKPMSDACGDRNGFRYLNVVTAELPNAIKEAGEGLALQVTKPARAAGLVEEDADGNATYRGEVRVHSFENVLLVVDQGLRRVDVADVAELVASLAGIRRRCSRRSTRRSRLRATVSSAVAAGGGCRVRVGVRQRRCIRDRASSWSRSRTEIGSGWPRTC